MGGHSGLNIGEGRGNAVVFAARIADAVVSGVPGARLAVICGGDKRNAIPREAGATLAVSAWRVARQRRVLSSSCHSLNPLSKWEPCVERPTMASRRGGHDPHWCAGRTTGAEEVCGLCRTGHSAWEVQRGGANAHTE